MEIVSVDFCMGGDGRVALYMDGRKIKDADYYYDKIDDFIEGFVFALEKLKIEHTFRQMIAVKENSVAMGIYENNDEIPETLQAFDFPD